MLPGVDVASSQPRGSRTSQPQPVRPPLVGAWPVRVKWSMSTPFGIEWTVSASIPSSRTASLWSCGEIVIVAAAPAGRVAHPRRPPLGMRAR